MAADLPPMIAPPEAVAGLEVRAARLPPWAGDPAFSIVRLSADQLQSRQRVDEALTATPGVSLFRRNSSVAANPTTQGLSMRGIAGSGAGRSLVTLDGVPQNDPFGGWVIWTSIPAESLIGADIVRGAGSGPYGAGALTGVVALDERSSRTPWFNGDASIGELGSRSASAAGGTALGAFRITGVASADHSEGYVAVREGAGAADNKLNLEAASYALKVETDLGRGVLAARAGYYREARQSGLVGANSRTKGETASLTYAVAPGENSLGYRLQAWGRRTDLMNSSASVMPNRVGTTVVNNQYETPTDGYGLNGALRGAGAGWTWELGGDYRAADGEDRELYATNLVNRRFAGGKTSVAGVYLEGTRQQGPFLLAAGIRSDQWKTTGSRRIQRQVANPNTVVGVDQFAPDREGTLPTGRLGVRYEAAPGFFLRAAAYAGFRPPSLNELHRPFTVGSTVTEANPGLEPEQLRGIEAGLNGEMGAISWSVTAFSNELKDAITNTTLCTGACSAPLQGYTALNGSAFGAGGILRQRRNGATVKATGVEGDVAYRIGDWTLRAAASYTDAQQGNLRPAQAVETSATAGFSWQATPALTLAADVRYEGSRFEDDLNTQKLGAATVANARIDYAIAGGMGVYVAADNVTDSRVQTGISNTTSGVRYYNEGPPRAVRVGVTVRR